MRLADLDSLNPMPRSVRVTACFSGYFEENDEDATLYLVLRDSSGEQYCLLDNESLGADYGHRLTMNALVDIDLERVRDLRRGQYRIRAIAPTDLDHIDNAAALLPLAEVPERAHRAFRKLIAFTGSLRNPFLRRFVNRVLLDPQIRLAFLKAGDGPGDEHQDPGGLLMRSTDQLDRVGDAARQVFPRTPTAVAVTQIAYLFHDIGKVVTHYGNASGTRQGLRSASLTSILMQPHLYWLSRLNVRAALAMQTVFDAFDHIPAPGYRFQFPGTPIVLACAQGSPDGPVETSTFQL